MQSDTYWILTALGIQQITEGKAMIKTLVELWTTADYFNVNPLMQDALLMLQSYCDAKLQDICRFCPTQSLPVIDFYDDLLEGIRAVYDLPTPMRGVLIGFVWGGRLLFFSNETLVALADEIPEFGRDIFKYMVGSMQSDLTPNGRTLDFSYPKLEVGPTTLCGRCGKACGSKNPRDWVLHYNPFQMKLLLGETCCGNCIKSVQKPIWRLQESD